MGFDCMWIASTGFHLIFWIASRLTTNLLPVLTRSSLVCTKQWFDCTHIRWHVSLERKRKINVQHSHKAIAKSKASIETYLVVYRVCSRSRLALCFSFFLCAFFFGFYFLLLIFMARQNAQIIDETIRRSVGRPDAASPPGVDRLLWLSRIKRRRQRISALFFFHCVEGSPQSLIGHQPVAVSTATEPTRTGFHSIFLDSNGMGTVFTGFDRFCGDFTGFYRVFLFHRSFTGLLPSLYLVLLGFNEVFSSFYWVSMCFGRVFISCTEFHWLSLAFYEL